MNLREERPDGGWRARVFDVIFLSDTGPGKTFDVALIGLILISLVVVMLDSVQSIQNIHAVLLRNLEWALTIVFTIEYAFRLATVKRPRSYVLSFYGLVDLFAILPTYVSLLFPGAQYLLVIRILRILRIFRVLKLATYLSESEVLLRALRASRHKIFVFVYTVITLVCLLGSLMYLVEGGPGTSFTSIPQGIYWAIVTLTTVGYGDIAPQTPAGQFLASIIMIMGYGIIAVPTGIVTVELSEARRQQRLKRLCPECGSDDHQTDASFCRRCGRGL